MSEYNDIKSLLDEISKPRSVLDEIDKYYREFLTNELKILGKSRGAGIILAEILTDFYTCAETLFLRISRFFENSLDYKKWHNDLLRKMTVTVEQLRPQVLANETYAILIEFLKFRHFRRYYFEVTAQVAARGGRLPESGWRPTRSGALGEDHELLGAGTKGLARNTRCKASKALMPFLRAVDT